MHDLDKNLPKRATFFRTQIHSLPRVCKRETEAWRRGQVLASCAMGLEWQGGKRMLCHANIPKNGLLFCNFCLIFKLCTICVGAILVHLPECRSRNAMFSLAAKAFVRVFLLLACFPLCSQAWGLLWSGCAQNQVNAMTPFHAFFFFSPHPNKNIPKKKRGRGGNHIRDP